MILDVIFEFAQWHALAKLRLYSEKTLHVFQEATKSLGKTVQKFQRTTCEDYHIQDLPKEEAARGRKIAVLRVKGVAPNGGNKDERNGGPKKKSLNLTTYKWHVLGDYASIIWEYRTTDNYTMQIVSVRLNKQCGVGR